MALPTASLTTLEFVQAQLDYETLTSAQSAQLEFAIQAAQSQIELLCNRSFHYREGHEERFSSHNSRNYYLELTPAKELESVHFDDEELDLINFALVGNRIYNKRGDFMRGSITVYNSPAQAVVAGEQFPSWRVTYTGGYVTRGQETMALPRTLPFEIEEAVVQLAATKFFSRGRDMALKREHLLEGGWWWDAEMLNKQLDQLVGRYGRIAQ